MIEIEDSKIQVSRDMAEVRARVDFKVGKNSDIDCLLYTSDAADES